MIKVLIVEDDPMVAQINRKYTESVKGFSVISVCSDGREAWDTIRRKNIDLIILDVYMPKLDGISILKQMRKEHIMIDVIMVTAVQEKDKLNEVLKLGAVDYLIKPFEYDRFKESLNRFMVRYKLLNEKDIICQDDIDKITNQKLRVTCETQKGLNRITLERVRNFMKYNRDKYFTSEDVAEKLKLSRVTIRRYMEYMASVGELATDIEYGDVGRPKHRYKYHE